MLEHTYPRFNKTFLIDLINLAKPFWQSSEKKKAYLLLTLNFLCLFGGVYSGVALNSTKKFLIDSLTNFDKPNLLIAISQFLGLAVLVFFCAGYGSYVTGLLSIRWQKWLTDNNLKQWLDGQTHYKFRYLQNKIDNPDQRIAEDLSAFPELTLKIFFLSLNAISTYISFSFVLWGLSSVLSFSLFGRVFHIPGYLYFSATFYGILGLWLVGLIGKKLAGLDYLQQKFNADFRTKLLNIREYGEQIALYKGENFEKKQLDGAFTKIVDNFLKANSLRKNLLFFSIGFEIVTQVIGLFLAIPLFFTRKVQMGGMMQISGAFTTVISAFSNMIEAYSYLAKWKAVVYRLTEFKKGLIEATEVHAHQVNNNNSQSNQIEFRDFNIFLEDGRPLLAINNLDFRLGKRYLLTGASGSGKTTLFRTIFGIWPYASGNLNLPEEALFILPQRSYLPFGQLKDILVYPNDDTIDDATLKNLLDICQLSHLKGELYIEKNWSQVLSLGQQQLIGFVRLFQSSAKLIFLDESTSALDESNEKKMYQLVETYFPDACIVSIGHRSSLVHYHHEIISLNKDIVTNDVVDGTVDGI